MNQWLVAGLGLGVATALAAAPGAIASLDEDPGTASRWHKRLASVVKAKYGGSSYHEAAVATIASVREADRLRDLLAAAQWWYTAVPNPSGSYVLTGAPDVVKFEWSAMQKETPAAAKAMERFDAYMGELARAAYVGRQMTGADLERFGDELVRFCDALDRDHNTEQAVDTSGDFVDAGEIVGGFVDDVVNPPLRAVAWGARKVTGIGVDAANAALDAAEAAAKSLVTGLGVTVLVTLGAVTVAGVVLWKYGGGKEIAKEAVKGGAA